jgi:Calcineurin-like phosphoesterase
MATNGSKHARGAADSEQGWTFASIPDFLNLDVGDLSSVPGWTPEMPNSTNEHYELLMRQVLDSISAEQPEFVLVAGDLVQGLWFRDEDELGLFGNFDSLSGTKHALRNAGDLYYGQWKQRFATRGLEVHAAVGDHELGDNPWKPGSRKFKLFPTFKDVFAQHFTKTTGGDPRYPSRPVGTAYEDTAYAFRHRDTVIVSVDTFSISEDEGVKVEVDADQMRWLTDVLERSEANPVVRHVIVQGHCPVLTPFRQTHSSGMTIEELTDSSFWKTLEDYRVDLYLCGEVHDVTASDRRGVVQIAHGANVGRAPKLNYLVGRVFEDRIELEIKQVDQIRNQRAPQFWQLSNRRPAGEVVLGESGFVTTGTLIVKTSITPHEILSREGMLDVYDPEMTVA